MTKDNLKDKFCALIYSPHLFSLLWGLIEPYLDESKFSSQDERDFEEWFKEFGVLPYQQGDAGDWWKKCAKRTWLAARKK